MDTCKNKTVAMGWMVKELYMMKEDRQNSNRISVFFGLGKVSISSFCQQHMNLIHPSALRCNNSQHFRLPNVYLCLCTCSSGTSRRVIHRHHTTAPHPVKMSIF